MATRTRRSATDRSDRGDASHGERRKAQAKEKKKEVILGIDLGTTITVCFAWIEGQAVPIHIDGEIKLPSVVCLRNSKQPVVGEKAKSEQGIYPNSTVVQAKRLIGHSFTDPEIQEDLKRWQFKVVADERTGNPRIKIGDILYAPEEISAHILRKVRMSAIAKTGAEVVKAVITVPAHFNDNQKQATRNAAVMAGFDFARIMTEPVAAALAHDISMYDTKKEILVFDLGGGTFDVSVLSLQKTDMGPIFVVKAIHGDSHLGGEDFDSTMVSQLLATEFKDVEWEAGEKGERYFKEFLCQLRQKCEKAKRLLGTELSTEITLSHVGKDHETREITITRRDFERWNTHLFDKCLGLVAKVADNAQKSGFPIGAILATGGSSQIPYLKSKLQSGMGIVDSNLLKCKDDPDTAVAMGACNFAASLWLPYEPNVPKMILIETCPYNIGIAVKGKTMDVFFERGTTMPATKTFSYTTVYDLQRYAYICIYEGMEDTVSQNHRLGTFIFELEPMPAGVPKIDVKVSIDIDGILTVLANDRSQQKSMEIRACKTTLSPQEVRQKKLKSDYEEVHSEVEDLQRIISEGLIDRYTGDYAKVISKWQEDKESVPSIEQLQKLITNDPALTKLTTSVSMLLKLCKRQAAIAEDLSKIVLTTEGENALSDLHYHTIFVVDRSYSMRKQDSRFLDGKVARRYDSVFECINKYLEDRSFSDDMFTMLLFNNKTRVGFTRHKYSKALHDKIQQIQENYPPHSTTSFFAAVNKVGEILDSDIAENTVIIFLSDGHDPEYPAACAAMNAIVESKKKRPSLYTIRFGQSKVSAEALEKLAEAGYGTFSSSRDGIALNETFGEIRRAIDEKNLWNSDNKAGRKGKDEPKVERKKVDAKKDQRKQFSPETVAPPANNERIKVEQAKPLVNLAASLEQNPHISPLVEEDKERVAWDTTRDFIPMRELVRKLLFKINLDGSAYKDYKDCFLTVYRSFMVPKQLLMTFIDSYEVLEEEMPAGAVFSEWRPRIQAHMKALLVEWVERFPEDFKSLRKELDKATESWSARDKTEVIKSLTSGLEAMKDTSLSLPSSASQPGALLFQSAKDIASQITLLQMKTYHQIRGYEFFDQAWASAKNRSSNLAKFLKFNEKLVNWVADIILSQTSIDLRAAMVAHLISIARELFNMSNFSGMVAVLQGLGLEPIHRLIKTKNLVSDKHRTEKVEYARLLSAVHNHQTALVIPETKCGVPWLDPPIADIVTTELSAPDMDKVTRTINWDQKVRIYNIITRTLQTQKVNSEVLKTWKQQKEVLSILQNFNHKPESELMNLSRALEPDL